MALKPPVPGGSNYKVTYEPNVKSAGVSLLILIWIPRLPAAVPDLEERDIAAGSVGTIAGIVPTSSDARRLEIRVDLPDGTGFGTLKLEVNGMVHSQEDITEDTTWTALVFP
jgi:hypothetical protein